MVLASTAASQVVFNQIVDNGLPESRLNLVVLGDGYTQAEMNDFNADVASMLSQFWITSPIHVYRTYFNAYTIFTPSNESGSDHPASGNYRDTYFSSSYDCYGIQRLICIPPHDWDGDPEHGEMLVADLLETYIPEYDIVIMLVNDPQYGGSGGWLAIASMHSQSREVTYHEFGHSFGNLADEYEDETPGYSGYEAPNATAETVRELIRWNDWIAPATPVPTPETDDYGGAVGLFEGAVYEHHDWYRPKLGCRMRSISVGFCQVCVEQVIRSEYNLLTPIDSVYPPNPELELVAGDSIWLHVTPMRPYLGELDIEWRINDSPVGQAESLLVSNAILPPGNSVIEVVVSDQTPFVRTDLDGLLVESFEWTAGQALCGDVNSNGLGPDIVDLIYLVMYMFQDGPPPQDFDQCDVNSSGGGPDITDLIALVEFMFQDGAPLNCP
jgi:hypothetical protein